ncbi:MAG TPA: aminotransferase class V-fold PLP-dependent enzyme [Pyrinomonadaceae bacterium]|nr:aminotransferase class V-fold PLP-dependent enzyme [Pyrinomonadaceae bacterium]
MKEAIDTRSSSLDISETELKVLSDQVATLVLEYFARVSELRVFPETSSGATLRRIGQELPLEGLPVEKILNDCRAIFDASRHNGHPRFFGYVASPATAPGAFADLISSALNANVTAWRSSPAATEVEQLAVRWLGSLVGFSDKAQGLLTSGGSLANLTAILMAHRCKSDGDVARAGLWNTAQRQTIYASDQIHMSIPKAADILGIGRDQVRLVPCDENFRINLDALRQRLQSDLKDGYKPICIVGSAGTVNTGAVDPLHELALIANEFDLWFHVDGAYGALAAMDETKRPLFRGIERADSLSLDAHKWLYTPMDAGCLLFRDEAKARIAFAANEADYIKVHEQTSAESFAFWDYGVELSRRFRALKIWMTLRYFGTRKIAAAIAEDIALAQYFAQKLNAAGDFEVLAPVELSICCFRYLPRKFRAAGTESNAAELDEINTRIMHAVQRGGDAYLSNATVNGKFALRVCITNFRTTRADLDHTIEVIRSAALSLEVE